ncbi:MAG TPA: protein kinase [Kofleriaceae bacterium]
MRSRSDGDGSDGPDAARTLAGPTQTSDSRPSIVKRGETDHEPESGSPPPALPIQFRDPRRYEFLGEHGRGGLGRVSRAHDRELGRDVAIKELLSRGTANEVRFLREVLITARLEHPSIVPIHEAGRWSDGTPFYAMKLVAGRPLRELLAERTTVAERIGLLHHVIAVADAIAYAHGRNIIHRDLKPANVIVGDFGETIVIDWGLAKDLSISEVSGGESGSIRILAGAAGSIGPAGSTGSTGSIGLAGSAVAGDVTSAGSVMGTPAYMAPEQRRGEPVDRRADVYAIGLMLWELVVPHRAPPARLPLRHRALRRAGIDEDLATIIEKALDPDPERRYPDAGALAADLKAFKSGARIAARSYSLFAMLAHWTRRHRALALSAVAALAVAITGSLVYVRNIAAERDRADLSNEAARRAQAVAETSFDELTLKHAELLLTTDPSAAIDALARYRGSEVERADQIRAHAAGLGVALVRAVPHTDNVAWAHGAPDGSILSISLDGTIARTTRDGASSVVSRGASRQGISAYSPSRHLLAYVCNPSDLCLFDVEHGAAFGVAPVLRNASFEGVSFSPDGMLLAVISHEAVLRILDITDPARPALRFTRTVEGGLDIEFAGDDMVVVGRHGGIDFVRMDGAIERFSLPAILRWEVDTRRHELALGTSDGEGLVVSGFPLHVAAQAGLCHGPTADLQFVPGRRSVAYACRDGAIGTWDLESNTVLQRARLEGHADLIAASAAGDYVIAAGGNGAVTVLDLTTDLIATYKGHGFRLTTLTPPGPDQSFLISGDVRGGLRAWPLPRRLVRVAATSSSSFHGAIFDDASATVTATTWQPALTVFSPATGVRSVEPHANENIFLARSITGRTFATYGLQGDTVEVWASPAMTRTRVIRTGHGSLSQLAFVAESEDFLTSGQDGRLVRWTPAGDGTPVVQFGQPIDHFAHAAATDAIVFSTVAGALWRTSSGGPVAALRDGGPRVNRLVALPDRQTVLAGTEDGDVIAIDTRSWQQHVLLHGGSVREIAFTADGRTIAVASNDGTIHVGTRRGDAPLAAGMTWTALPLRARHITLVPDGLLVASCTDGTIWLYTPASRRWLCLPTGTVDLGRTAATADGKVAIALDFEGRLLWIDLEAARQLLQGRAIEAIKTPHQGTRSHEEVQEEVQDQGTTGSQARPPS